MPGRKRLTADDWTRAALEALADGGVAAVAVEPLAARLGATKGSFYWHFADRAALLAATLERWEHDATEAVIAAVDAEPDGARRLRLLLATALAGPAATVELALQPTAAHPLVAPVLRRVTARRLGYLAETFSTLGFGAEDAGRRSLLAYSAFLGHGQLRHATPEATPGGPALAAYVDSAVELLTAR